MGLFAIVSPSMLRSKDEAKRKRLWQALVDHNRDDVQVLIGIVARLAEIREGLGDLAWSAGGMSARRHRLRLS